MTKANKTEMRGPEALFKPTVESIKLDYGDFWFHVGRAGATNKSFKRAMDKKMKPHRRAMANDTMSDKVAEGLVMEVWAEAIVEGWGSKLGEGKMPLAGEVLDFTVENCVKLFKALPDLFVDIREQSSKLGLFIDDDEETDGKN